jgi:hypothetical protein
VADAPAAAAADVELRMALEREDPVDPVAALLEPGDRRRGRHSAEAERPTISWFDVVAYSEETPLMPTALTRKS